MKASFLHENLQAKLSFLIHAVSQRGQLPSLSNFLIEAFPGKITISATDLEIGIVSSFSANVEKEGAALVPAKTFYDLLSNLSEGKITLELKETTLYLNSNKVKTKFQTTPKEDFPKIYEQKGEKIATLKKEGLESEFSRVVFAASQDTGRPALSGVLIKKTPGGVFAIATDGFRLSLQKTSSLAVDPKKAEVELLIPSRMTKELFSIKDDGEEIEIFTMEESGQILFSMKNTILAGRLIEAEYPDYEKIIPQGFSIKTTFDRKEMLSAVKIASVFARDSANIIRFSLEKKRVLVSSATPGAGENTVEVVAATEGEDNEIAFNARYLLDLFSNTDMEKMSLEMTGPLNPGVFKSPEDATFLHLIMPIKVQE
ncbi:DNA polymerase III subunit beta [Patescibacteria group bacterium]|nr:DNA polymerase III subunit beta [Patescibacteria group bacterium]